MFPFRISAVMVLSFRLETASYSPYKQDWLHGEGWKLRPHVGKRRQTRKFLDWHHLRSYPLSSPATCMASPVMSFVPKHICLHPVCIRPCRISSKPWRPRASRHCNKVGGVDER
ncbi:hypothetical protein EV421DRAFT_1782969 [Armillaria borealis]|uniref:Secreted protein n=1 Tax=Armillaria borealis TaxID=47425 RepID=A0AA39MWE8_9AGAR|nr:hypothetical protein EV421DRAFT_1782969 [Armillaria borealis]